MTLTRARLKRLVKGVSRLCCTDIYWFSVHFLDKYQVSILRKLRDINMDYHHVGWYQSTYLGSHVTKEFLESHVDYQRSIEESVVLIYGKGWTL